MTEIETLKAQLAQAQAELQQQAGVILALREKIKNQVKYISHQDNCLILFGAIKQEYERVQSESCDCYYDGSMVICSRCHDLNILNKAFSWPSDSRIAINTTEAAQKARDAVRREAIEACRSKLDEIAYDDKDGSDFVYLGEALEALHNLKTQEGK